MEERVASQLTRRAISNTAPAPLIQRPVDAAGARFRLGADTRLPQLQSDTQSATDRKKLLSLFMPDQPNQVGTIYTHPSRPEPLVRDSSLSRSAKATIS